MVLSPDESHHLVRVLRARKGDPVLVFDGLGREARARLDKIKPTVLEVIEVVKVEDRPVELVLFQALPKGKRMDLIVEKGTELGVSMIVPMETDRVVSRLSGSQKRDRVLRWWKLALSAAKQCQTRWVPVIEPVSDYGEAIKRAASLDLFLIGSLAKGATPVREVLRGSNVKRVGIAIGPEGDFTEDELRCAVEHGAVPVSFGPLVFRVETAALYALSVLSYELL